MDVLIAGDIVQRTVYTVILVVTDPKSLCKGQTVENVSDGISSIAHLFIFQWDP